MGSSDCLDVGWLVDVIGVGVGGVGSPCWRVIFPSSGVDVAGAILLQVSEYPGTPGEEEGPDQSKHRGPSSPFYHPHLTLTFRLPGDPP